MIELTHKGAAVCRVLFEGDDTMRLAAISVAEDRFMLECLTIPDAYSPAVNAAAEARLVALGLTGEP